MRYICIGEIFAGALILLISIVKYYRSLIFHRQKAHEQKLFSQFTFALCMALMVFFLLGYLVMGISYTRLTQLGNTELLIANVFLFGAIFVYVVIHVQGQMSCAINDKTDEITRTLVNAVEAKDQYTRGHSVHVANLTELLYHQLPHHLKKTASWPLLMDAAILHDIGKIGIPDQILNKPGKLSEEEMSVIRQHPRLGKQILEQTSFKELGDIILYHHERMDHKGYYRIPPEQIPIESRMICITDTFSALYSDRVYRPRKSFQEAIDILRSIAGSQLDKELVEIFCTIPEEMINKATCNLFILEEKPYSFQDKARTTP